MTVAELIEKLKQFPPDRKVLVDGYEHGYDDPEELYSLQVRGYNMPYCGHYDDWEGPSEKPWEWAVIIPR
jgi:hypothetical protein